MGHCGRPPSGAASARVYRSLTDFSVKDVKGREWRLPDLKGKVTFLDFWATWCGPCVGELPELEKLYQRLAGRKDLQLVTIKVDRLIADMEKAYKK